MNIIENKKDAPEEDSYPILKYLKIESIMYWSR